MSPPKKSLKCTRFFQILSACKTVSSFFFFISTLSTDECVSCRFSRKLASFITFLLNFFYVIITRKKLTFFTPRSIDSAFRLDLSNVGREHSNIVDCRKYQSFSSNAKARNESLTMTDVKFFVRRKLIFHSLFFFARLSLLQLFIAHFSHFPTE